MWAQTSFNKKGKEIITAFGGFWRYNVKDFLFHPSVAALDIEKGLKTTDCFY